MRPTLRDYFGEDGPPVPPKFGGFFTTVLRFFASPAAFFAEVRRLEDVLPSLKFAATGASLGALGTASYVLLFALASAQSDGRSVFANLLLLMPYLLAWIGLNALCAVVGVGLFTLLYTVSLSATGAKTQTAGTFRVTAYTWGAVSTWFMLPLAFIPFTPIFIAILYWTYSTIGLREVHQISGGRAAFAVLLTAFVVVILSCAWLASLLIHGLQNFNLPRC